MQNTRLNNLTNTLFKWVEQGLRNPWRRIAILVISVLLGNFLATIISTIAGQEARLDVLEALILVLLCESISWVNYGTALGKPDSAQPVRSRSIVIHGLNGLKLGLTYGLFVEAFKLGS